MPSIFQAMLAPAPPATPLSRFTAFTGLFNLPIGLLLLVYPQALELTGYPPIGDAAGPLRGVGICVVYISCFYLAVARSRFAPAALATVVARIFLGPLMILPLVFLKLMHPLLGIPLMISDLVMGAIMWVIWARTEGASNV